jgi:hypothetical protein
VNAKVQKLWHKITYGHAAQAFFGIWQGRCTFFACLFSVIGCYGWLRLNRDLTSFALFAGAIQSLILAKSVSDDYHDRATKVITKDISNPTDTVTTVQNDVS